MARTLTPHPIAALFPDLLPSDFAALVEDIRQRGVKVPILVYRGQILDGRQRYRACQQLNRPCPTQEWNGRDPWLEVQSRNLMRRHLSKDQIYAIYKLAAEQFPELMASIQTIKEEAKDRRIRKPQRSASAAVSPVLRSRDRNREAADLIGARLGVSGTTVKRVDRLAREAPELVRKVASGELSVKKALGQITIETHADAQGSRQVEALQVQRDVKQLERTIKATWGRCPIEHRAKILYALQAVLRQLIEEQTADAGGQRPQTLRAS
jgi:hypothetical protein